MQNFFLKLCLLIGVSFTSLYAYDNCGCCSRGDQLGTGFLIGAYGAFDTFYFHASNTETDSNQPGQLTAEWDMIQQAPGGGGFAGYGCGFCDVYSLAFIVSATGFTNSAQHQFFEVFGSNSNLRHKVRLCYVVDLSLQPGVLVSNCLLAYFKVGASYAGFKHAFRITDIDIPLNVVASKTRDEHQWGYVIGAGFNFAITECMSGFVEYDWRAYCVGSVIELGPVFQFTNEKHRVDNVHGSWFKIGLMTSF